MNCRHALAFAALSAVVFALTVSQQGFVHRYAYADDPSRSPDATADQLAADIQARVSQAVSAALEPGPETAITEFESLAVMGSWTEVWPDADGKEASREVEARLWDGAIRAALDKSDAVFLPKRNVPYYIHDPILLKSGQRIRADRDAEIRLVPGASTCMVRNEHLLSGQAGAIPGDFAADMHILIEGGIWTTLATTPTQSNGNDYGRSARQGEIPCCHGVIILNSVRGVVVRNIVVRQSRAHAIQLSNCHDFLVDGVTFDRHRRDGVHVNGPASYGVIRNIAGDTGDDMVALNAWDWSNTAPAFGPIHHVLVEGVRGNPQLGGTDEIRLLPGTKTFDGGAKLDCPVSDCVLQDLYDIRTFKMYDQPNLERGRDNDFCDPIGTVGNLHFHSLVFNRPGKFQVAANVDGLSIEDVQLNFDLDAAANQGYRLVEIGPMSQTYKFDNNNPASWVELFSPDRDVTVRNFRLADVRKESEGETAALPDAESRLVRVADQKPNPDYPNTTPRGGKGRAILVP